MARFALLLPREEMVEPAGRIARELEMDVVLNQSVPTERILDLMEDCRRAGADILVARGRQASILKEHTDFPVVEIQLTGLEDRPAAPPGPQPGLPSGAAEDRCGDHPQHGGQYSGL